ncbi:MAG: DUF6134 family protein [Ferruginibacter sp.]
MIPMLIYLLFKKIREQKEPQAGSIRISPVFKSCIKALVCILVFLFLSSILINARGQKLNYKVVRNGSEIGWMKLEKTTDGNFCKMILSSEIRFHLIILLSATVVESACFDNGRLIFSSQYHKTNGSVKVNEQTRLTPTGYEVTKANEKEKLDIPDVNFNLICLYFQEPYAQKRVYCDKQQSFADIEKTGDGGYKVRFPNGDSNCYYYTDGVCSKVKIEHTFYSAEIILNP